MGSKSKIARWVVERLPYGDTLYDVFCGGCAITDYAMRTRKYKSYVSTMTSSMLGVSINRM